MQEKSSESTKTNNKYQLFAIMAVVIIVFISILYFLNQKPKPNNSNNNLLTSNSSVSQSTNKTDLYNELRKNKKALILDTEKLVDETFRSKEAQNTPNWDTYPDKFQKIKENTQILIQEYEKIGCQQNECLNSYSRTKSLNETVSSLLDQIDFQEAKKGYNSETGKSNINKYYSIWNKYNYKLEL